MLFRPAQTFVLIPDAGSYFVFNDIFRYVAESCRCWLMSNLNSDSVRTTVSLNYG